jgi:hypothetical protein
MANWRVLGVGAGLNRTHHHFAGIRAHPHLEWSFSLGSHPVAVAPHLFLHSQSGIERTLWMVFVRDRRSEQRASATVLHRSVIV